LKPFLLDVNVLIALAWPSHVHHGETQRWFAARRAAGFRTCPLTETGFVRISSNPQFIREAVSPSRALDLLRAITSLPQHKFWPDDLPLWNAVWEKYPIVGHRQVTDAYLLALAASRDGVVATLDRGLMALDVGKQGLAELVGGFGHLH
jgi:toxin-antitoxin system PIN domain toxin